MYRSFFNKYSIASFLRFASQNQRRFAMNPQNDLSPVQVRKLIRAEKFEAAGTPFLCPGFKQANLAIIPQQYADDFANVAKGTTGALPILYKSKVGEFSADPLGDDIDVRTDLLKYNVMENGVITKQVNNLLDYDLSDYVVFYIGCSFSFNEILIKNNIFTLPCPINNVAMYKSSIDVYKSGLFNGKMIVSMRYIKKERLSDLGTLTFPLDDVHGSPIHYGNPALIGIDVNKNVIGDEMTCGEGEIATFFCCGVTGCENIMAANLKLAFSHSPGHMLITDVKQESGFIETEDKTKICHVFEYDPSDEKYSVMSRTTLEKLNALDRIIQEDPGNRGIVNLIVKGDFVKAATALSHADSVALITGFPCNDCSPPDETDGLPGILSLGAALQAFGKQLTIIVEEASAKMYREIIKKCFKEGLLKEEIFVKTCENNEVHDMLFGKNNKPLYDVVLASERVGRGIDGRHYSMKAKDLSNLVNSKVDDIFEVASKDKTITTIGIGDGGNELGMGKVLENVKTFIPNGKTIGCSVAANVLIAAGVSNWGCYALGLALFSLRSCAMHDRYLRKAIGFPTDVSEHIEDLIPTVARERKILGIVESFGIKDGRTPDQSYSVDGMLFDNKHTAILKSLRNVVGL